MYAINLDNENRILRATKEQYADSESILVTALPDGDITEYKYINNQYVHEPLAVQEIEEAPTLEEDLNAMAVEHEYRLTLLELGL